MNSANGATGVLKIALGGLEKIALAQSGWVGDGQFMDSPFSLLHNRNKEKDKMLTIAGGGMLGE